ncbi:hypothetical protein EPUL_000607 [Erysiphe pulchra]|uniref:Zn(2)-C6 fungal-type domain-containing protein n=1 Tax=Erysiphe pulchra TaxID=225359 RepID=A0A2S4Q1X0_9PEZI|nr:hypothetical protein EPUL_000607 [Erysiphe pulchra]
MILGIENAKDMSLKKTRAGKPKCGEEKPYCLRCSRSGFKCDGYQNNSVEKTNRKKLPRLLIPKTRRLPSQPSLPLSHSSICDSTIINSKPKLACDSFELLNKLCYTPITSSSPEENRHTFVPLPKLLLSSPFSQKRNDYFSTIPHKVNILSPSTYASTLTPPDSASINTPQCYDTCSEDQKDSFISCNRRESCRYPVHTCLLYREVDGLRFEIHCTFFTCLLFQIFENFDFHHDENENDEKSPSLVQVTAGIRKIREWVTGTPQESKVASNSSYFAKCQGQMQNNRNHKNNFDSADALLKTLESYVANIAESRTREKYTMFWHQSQKAIRCIPQIWSTLDEARKSLVEVVERNQHWLRLTMYLNFSEPQNSPLPIYSFCSSLIPNLSCPDVFLSFSSTAPERTQMLDELSRWDSAFQPLLNASHMSCAAQSDFLVTSILRMQWLASWILSSDEAIGGYDINANYGVKKWIVEFNELSGIADILLREWPSHQCLWKKAEDRGIVGFDIQQQREIPKRNMEDMNDNLFMQYWVFSLPFLVPLITIAWHYRHRCLRALTVKLLNYCPDQDTSVEEKNKDQDVLTCERSGFNGQIMAKIMAWLFSIEEESWCLGTFTTMKSPVRQGDDGNYCCPESSSIWCCSYSKTPSTNIDEGSFVSGEDVKSDCIPDWARASHVSMSYDEEGKGIKVRCYQAVRSLGSHVGQWRDVLIPW